MDIWGDKVQSATLPGDLFRRKHDTLKLKIFNLANECRLPASCKVFSAFAAQIPQRGLSRIEKGRARQSIIPDFKFDLPRHIDGNPVGGRVATLAELKTISFCPSYHFPGAEKRGVEVRADQLPAIYLRKARVTDRDYCETAEDTIGPVETHLRKFPPLVKLVVGPMAECSDDLHELLHTMAESKVSHNARTAGREETEEAYASTIAYLRRQISVCAVRAAADSLFSRLLQVGQQGPGVSGSQKTGSSYG